MNANFIEILEGLAVIIASLVAIYGINSWRREMKGRKEYELAEEVLALFYEAQDKISAIRSPMGWAGEGQSREAGPDESPTEKEILNQAYVVFERYQKNQEPLNKLHALRYRFMASFGQDKAKPFDELRSTLNKIFIAARMLAQLWRRQMYPAVNGKRLKKLTEDIRKYEAIFWEGMTDPDPISPKVNQSVSDIENICEKILRPKPSWFSRIFSKK